MYQSKKFEPDSISLIEFKKTFKATTYSDGDTNDIVKRQLVAMYVQHNTVSASQIYCVYVMFCCRLLVCHLSLSWYTNLVLMTTNLPSQSLHPYTLV